VLQPVNRHGPACCCRYLCVTVKSTGGSPATHPAMQRPTYFLRINGLAATSDFTANKIDRYLDRCIANRPDAVIDLVQVDPADGREICSSVVYRPNVAINA